MIGDGELMKYNGNILEVHYWFGDDSHSMSANVYNKCDYELLAIIKETARLFSIEISIETLPVEQGGLRKWLKIVSKEENKKSPITTAILIAIIVSLLTTPIGKVSEKIIEKIFEDTELKNLEKEKLKLEIEKLKYDLSNNGGNIENNVLIKKRKSNFYDTLEKYPKVEKVSFSIADDSTKNKIEEKIVLKVEFKNFILVTDELESLDKEDAIIEIISPVLKKGKYRWMGYYNGEVIAFNMKSNEFKGLVQNGEIEFKNGSSINCFLKIRKIVDNEGIEKVVRYDVTIVNHYFQNDKPIETKEGRHHRQKIEAQKQQLKFIFENSEQKDK